MTVREDDDKARQGHDAFEVPMSDCLVRGDETHSSMNEGLELKGKKGQNKIRNSPLPVSGQIFHDVHS